MFEEVTKKSVGKPAVRKSAFLALSALLQVLLVTALVFVGDRLRAAVTRSEPIIEVKFFKTPPPAAPAAPPPPPRKRTAEVKPQVARSREASLPKPMIQPKEVPPTPQLPRTSEQPEPEPAGESGAQSKADEGVEGGVGGGVPGGQAGGGAAVEEMPAYATAGYRKPELAVPSCLQNSLNLSREQQRSVSGSVAVKFAIRRDGSPAYFQVLTQLPDGRVGDAIRRAVERCQWIAGADAQGRPASIWVILPIRFASG